ncbi:endocuticle structural glycoprotein ABD-4-like [Leguminivora glycinivorella]|uniref:endocuticle structural glycoprotein ABD-4-like n=1 Tax=Leguminivora glycinivorella TaxID=1035111 RepID=UPI00200D9730|nr:endocuticle structural glycoprotein ABD-4-like [Leguminivora glycinivorella]
MKLLVVAVCLMGLVCAQDNDPVLFRIARAVSAVSDQAATVLRSDSVVQPDGFQYGFETDNGISVQASGSLKKLPEGESLVIQGQYQYTAPDGTPVQVNYESDESGYHPQGAHIPTPHPIPEAIARALQYIEAHPPPVEKRP